MQDLTICMAKTVSLAWTIWRIFAFATSPKVQVCSAITIAHTYTSMVFCLISAGSSSYFPWCWNTFHNVRLFTTNWKFLEGMLLTKKQKASCKKNAGFVCTYVSESILEHRLQEFWLGPLELHLGLPNFTYNRSGFRKWASFLMTYNIAPNLLCWCENYAPWKTEFYAMWTAIYSIYREEMEIKSVNNYDSTQSLGESSYSSCMTIGCIPDNRIYWTICL